MRALLRALAAAITATSFVVVAVSPAWAQTGRPGVTPSTINVGGMAALENFVGQPYGSTFDGVQAYFNYVNAKGGAYGHKFKLIAKLDDQDSPSTDLVVARSLIEEKHVFAILPVAVDNFTAGSYLARSGVPTLGWNINAQWASGYPTPGSAYPPGCVAAPGADGTPCTSSSGAPNLFGDKGSFLCFTCPDPAPGFVAAQLGIRNVAILAYSVPQSASCAAGLQAGFERFGSNIVVNDHSLQPGFSDLGSDVDAMRAGNVQLVATCMDVGADVRAAQALKRAGLMSVKFFAPQGYDPQTLKKYGAAINGFYFLVGFVPFEEASISPGLQLFVKQMHKLGKPVNELSLAGWIDADLLYKGIKAAGPTFTQTSVVQAINQINGYTADGIRPPINWSFDGHRPGHEGCGAFVEAVNGKYVGQFGRPGQPFLCSQALPLPTHVGPDTLYYRPPKPGEVLPSSATVPTTSPPTP